MNMIDSCLRRTVFLFPRLPQTMVCWVFLYLSMADLINIRLTKESPSVEDMDYIAQSLGMSRNGSLIKSIRDMLTNNNRNLSDWENEFYGGNTNSKFKNSLDNRRQWELQIFLTMIIHQKGLNRYMINHERG